MFNTESRPGTTTAPTRAPGRRCSAASPARGGAAPRRTDDPSGQGDGEHGGSVAREHGATYDTGRAQADAATDGGTLAPRTAIATQAYARLDSTPGSPLAETIAGLADTVASLAALSAEEEHVSVVGDALLALGHLHARMDATLLSLLESFDRRQQGPELPPDYGGARCNHGGMNRHQRAAVDDLRAAFDRDDDDAVRDALERLTRRHDEPGPPLEPPRPLGPGEAVCRSCRLVVRRAHIEQVALLVCDDCYRA